MIDKYYYLWTYDNYSYAYTGEIFWSYGHHPLYCLPCKVLQGAWSLRGLGAQGGIHPVQGANPLMCSTLELRVRIVNHYVTMLSIWWLGTVFITFRDIHYACWLDVLLKPLKDIEDNKSLCKYTYFMLSFCKHRHKTVFDLSINVYFVWNVWKYELNNIFFSNGQ